MIFQKIKEIIESDQFILAGHRGHSFHFRSNFSEESYTDKILFLGVVEVTRVFQEMQEKYPKAQIICYKDTGEGQVNNAVIYGLIKKIAEGKKSWEELTPGLQKKKDWFFLIISLCF